MTSAPSIPKSGALRPGLGSADHDRAPSLRGPHLSHSRINRYLHCPEQYRLYYIENLRPRYQAASLVFGQVIHQTLAVLFRSGGDPVGWFANAWAEVKPLRLRYGARESWEKLDASGRALLEKFVAEELPRLGAVEAVERAFELDVTSLDLPLVGIIDLTAELDRIPTVVDFKTSGSSYGSHEATLSDQLAAYRLAEPDVRQAAFCVLVKTKEPAIEWHLTRHSGAQLLEYLTKARLVAREIKDARFYKRPGKWCAWCDYLPVCVGDVEKADRDLVSIGRPGGATGHAEAT